MAGPIQPRAITSPPEKYLIPSTTDKLSFTVAFKIKAMMKAKITGASTID